MLDIKWIRDNAEEFKRLLIKRGIELDLQELLDLDEERRQLINLIQQFQFAKNNKTKKLATLKGKSLRDFEEARKDVAHINDKLEELTKQLEHGNKLQVIMENLPNMPAFDVPYGKDETMNNVVRSYKQPTSSIKARHHFELGIDLGMMDFEQTAKISGSRFVTLKSQLAALERALINFMIDIHTTRFEFTEISVPALVKPSAMYNVGQLPKFAAESYETSDGKYRLIPTAEVTITNMVADMILKDEELPIRFVGYTPCFRSEAGSAGKDTRGMIRNHQFGKVELISITTPEESEQEHSYMLNASEEILKKLDIPYRVMLLCSGDMGFSAKKTYDLEAWLPGQQQYREIASISNCGEFVARRMKTRYKKIADKDTRFVHSLNGSGLPIGRTIVAIMENYQNPDGSITVPESLRSYMGGIDKISKVCN